MIVALAALFIAALPHGAPTASDFSPRSPAATSAQLRSAGKAWGTCLGLAVRDLHRIDESAETIADAAMGSCLREQIAWDKANDRAADAAGVFNTELYHQARKDMHNAARRSALKAALDLSAAP